MKIAVMLSLSGALALFGCASTEETSEEDVGVAADALVVLVGTTTLSDAEPGSGSVSESDSVMRAAPRFATPAVESWSGTLDAPPSPAPTPIAAANPGLFGFNGITHLQQRLAGTGIYENTQGDLEPPDPVVCVGNGRVLEVVNDALTVFDTEGNRIVPVTALNQFFQRPPLINRETGTFGSILFDPKCHFDADTDRWFITLAENVLDPVTGDLGPVNRIALAVSQSGDPAGDWFLFAIDVSNDGRQCPCSGDQPLIGADKFGFYISTNAFSLVTGQFVGAQIYALSRASLVAGTSPKVVRFGNIPIGLGQGVSIQPARVPPSAPFNLQNGGTQYFMSSILSDEIQDRIAVWELTNTRSLDKPHTRLRLAQDLVPSEAYGTPPPALQKAGPRPLSFVCDEGLLEQLDTQDARMQQVMYADGKLWSALTTIVDGCHERAGVAYFIVEPQRRSCGRFDATIVNQGYVALSDTNSVIYPAVGVNAAGEGAIAFTVSGPDFFPSAGYAPLDAVHGAGEVHIASAGVAPEDGFTGYPGAPCNGTNGIARWGDYSGASVAEDGSIWMSTEYIPDEPRTLAANWGTFIARLIP